MYIVSACAEDGSLLQKSSHHNSNMYSLNQFNLNMSYGATVGASAANSNLIEFKK